MIRSKSPGMSPFKRTTGVIGMGNIGREAAIEWIGTCQSRPTCYDFVAPANIWPDIPHE